MPSRRRHRAPKSLETSEALETKDFRLTSLNDIVGAPISKVDEEVLKEIKASGGSFEHTFGLNIAMEFGVVPSRKDEITKSIIYLVSRGLLTRVEIKGGYIISTPNVHS